MTESGKRSPLEAYGEWFDEASLDPPVAPFRAVFQALVSDSNQQDVALVDTICNTVPKCVKAAKSRLEFAKATTEILSARPSALKLLWTESARRTVEAWAVPDDHVFFFLILCDIYMIDDKATFRKEDILCIALERCYGKTRPSEGNAKFLQVLKSESASWEKFENAALSKFPLAVRSKAIHALCILARDKGVAPAKFMTAYTDAIFTAKSSLEEDAKKTTWAFKPLLESLSTDDVTNLLAGPVGRALRLTTEKSLPAAILLCESLDCNIIPDDCMLIPAVKALRTSSKENVQDMAAKLVGMCLGRAAEASCGGVLKELCDELPREGSLYRRTRMVSALSIASTRVTLAWSKMVFSTLLKRARDEKLDETKAVCLDACLSWITPNLAGEPVDADSESILASKSCYSISGFKLIQLVASEMKLAQPAKEQIIKDLEKLVGGSDAEFRVKLYGIDALLALGSKTHANKLDLALVDVTSEQDCLAAVRILSRLQPEDAAAPPKYYIHLASLLANPKFATVHQEARRVCDSRVIALGLEKSMMRTVGLGEGKDQILLTKFAIQSMLPAIEKCDAEHLGLALVLCFRCATKDRRSTWQPVLKQNFSHDSRKDALKHSLSVLFHGDRMIDIDALSEALAIDPQAGLVEPLLITRLDPAPILSSTNEETLAAYMAPPGGLSEFARQKLNDGGSDDEDESEEGRARALRQGRRGRGGARKEIYSAENEEWERKIRAEQKEKKKLQQGPANAKELSPQELQALKHEEELRLAVTQKVRRFENAANAVVAITRIVPLVAQALADKVIPLAMSLTHSPLVTFSATSILDAYMSLVFARDTRLNGEIRTQLRRHERANPAVLIQLNDVCQNTMTPLGKDLFELIFPVIQNFTKPKSAVEGGLVESVDDESLESVSMNENKDAVTDAMFNLVALHHSFINQEKREALLPGLLHVVSQTPLASSLDCVISLFSSEKPSEKEINVLVGDDGLLHKESAVRLAALTALKRADITPKLSAYLWFAASDSASKNRSAALSVENSLVPNYYEVIVPLLSNKQDHVRYQAARAIALGLEKHRNEASKILKYLLNSYKEALDRLKKEASAASSQIKFFERGASSSGAGKLAEPDPAWYHRSGVAFTLSALAGLPADKNGNDAEDGEPAPAIGAVLEPSEALAAIEFVLSDGTRDPHPTVRAQMISAGTSLLQANGTKLGETVIGLVQSYLGNKKGSSTLSEFELDRQREGAVIFLGAAAACLSPDDDRIPEIASKLVAALETPSETVQRAAVRILPQLMKCSKFKAENGGDGGRELVELCMNKALSPASSFGSRAGHAMGIAAIVKGLGISALKTFSIVPRLTEASASDKWETRQGSLFCFDELTESLGRLFEPYVVQIVEPVLLKSFSDGHIDVRDAAHAASKKIMANMSGPGVSMLLPKLLSGIASLEWRTKQAAILMLGSVAFCAPKQLSSSLPQVVPKLIDAFTDTHPKVRAAALSALKDVQSVVKNPEIEKISLSLIGALTDPHERTKDAVDVLFQTRFVHAVDAPSLALLVPILRRGLKERATETKKRSALIVGNMISMISDAKAVKPYLEDLMPVLKTVLVDPIPGVRGTAAKAMGTLVRGLGAEGIPDFAGLFQFLIETMLHGMSSVERQGGAQGFVEVLVALQDEEALTTGLQKEIFDRAKDPSSDPMVREGAMWGLVFLPTAMENVSHYALEALTCALTALSDDTESVRDAALRCSRVYVGQFTTTNPEIVLSALEMGLIHFNWRVRQTSVRLLGDFITALQKTFWNGPEAAMLAAPMPPPEIGADEEEEEFSEDEEEEDEELEEKTPRGSAAIAASSEPAESSSEGPVDAVLLKLFGAERRDALIATVYLMRSDGTSQVRQNALFVWKSMVSNTPRTMKRIIKPLMRLVVQHLSSTDPDRQRAGGRALADVVKKLGDRVLPEIVPVVLRGLDSESEDERVGVAMGLFELVGATTKTHLEPQATNVLEAILKGLCDEHPRVSDFAGKTFNRVHVLLGAQIDGPATTYVLTRLCDRLEEDEEKCTRGMTQAVESRSRDCLGFLLPKLLVRPMKPCNIRALAKCMAVVPSHLHHYLRQILRALVVELAEQNLGPPMDTESELWQACASCLIESVAEEQAVSTLLVETTDFTGSAPDGASRRAAMALLQSFLANTEDTISGDLGAAVALKCTIRLFADQDSAALNQAVAAFAALVKNVGAESMAEHVDFVRNSVRTVASMDKHRPGMDKRPEYELPAFGLKMGMDAMLEIYLYALMNGDNEERESAAEGLGELVDLTYAETLKPYVVKITGPLIRIVGDRFPAQVKSAILDTLRKLLVKGGAVLRPFLPQLQTTFVKALQNTTDSVRSGGFKALQVLVPLSPRVDPLCSELVQGCTSADPETRQQMVRALFYVLASRLSDVSLAGLNKILEKGSAVDTCVSDWQDPTVRVLSAAVEVKALEGAIALAESPEQKALLDNFFARLTSRLSACVSETQEVNVRHGALLSLDAVLRSRTVAALAAKQGIDPMTPLEQASGDDVSMVRGVACDAAGWAVLQKSAFPGAQSLSNMLQQASKSDADSMVRSIAEFSMRRDPETFNGALDKMEAELA